jgi:hypothetical protein
MENITKESGTMEHLNTREGDVNEMDSFATGAGCAGRTPSGTGRSRRRTVKAKKSRRGIRSRKNPGGKIGTGPRAGEHVRPGVLEAIRVLRAEGYIAGKIAQPGLPFDIMGYRDRHVVLFRVIRTRHAVANAVDVKDLYEDEIRRLQPYWHSDADNLQLWIISRENGILRYYVYRSGIRNVSPDKKPQEIMAGEKTAPANNAIRRMRNAPCPDKATGAAG